MSYPLDNDLPIKKLMSPLCRYRLLAVIVWVSVVCRLLPPAIPFSVSPLEKTVTQKWFARGGKVPKIASYLSLLIVSFGELAGLVHDNFTLPWVWLNRFCTGSLQTCVYSSFTHRVIAEPALN
jgi:hypothetical protein